MANNNPLNKLTDAEKSGLLASARIIYADPTGAEFWAEFAERMRVRAELSDNNAAEDSTIPDVEPLPRRE